MTVWFLVTFVVATALYLWMIFPSVHRCNVSFLLNAPIAHRGLYDNVTCAENSLSAVKAAVAQGLTTEIDVRLTYDAVPIVIHDSSLLRMCGVKADVSSLTLAQLSEFRLLNSGEHIPTLREVLDTVDARVPLLIELKSSYRSTTSRLCTVRAVADVLKGYSGKYAVQSFDPLLLRRMRKMCRNVPIGQLTDKRHFFEGVHRFASSRLLTNFLCRPDFIAYGYTEKLPFTVRLVRHLGCALIAWTLNTPEQARSAALRFDGIIAERINEISRKSDV